MIAAVVVLLVAPGLLLLIGTVLYLVSHRSESRSDGPAPVDDNGF